MPNRTIALVHSMHGATKREREKTIQREWEIDKARRHDREGVGTRERKTAGGEKERAKESKRERKIEKGGKVDSEKSFSLVRNFSLSLSYPYEFHRFPNKKYQNVFNSVRIPSIFIPQNEFRIARSRYIELQPNLRCL